jgi:hypothetical protein
VANTSYPFNVAEAQGEIIGTDLVVMSGFNNRYNQSTPACYACNLNVTSAQWCRMDDVPVVAGITHGAFAIVGMKFYMCGRYVFHLMCYSLA